MVSSVAFVIIGIFVIQDKYKGEPQIEESIKKSSLKSPFISQQNDINWIKDKVNEIENNPDLKRTEFDWVELTGIATDGGGILKVWRSKSQICKIDQEIGLSYGRIRTIIYLERGIPIKIIDTEEKFGQDNGEFHYDELNEVFKATIYVFDWDNNKSKIERIGKRFLSKGNCSTFEYEPILEQAEKATSQ